MVVDKMRGLHVYSPFPTGPILVNDRRERFGFLDSKRRVRGHRGVWRTHYTPKLETAFRLRSARVRISHDRGPAYADLRCVGGPLLSLQ